MIKPITLHGQRANECDGKACFLTNRAVGSEGAVSSSTPSLFELCHTKYTLLYDIFWLHIRLTN